MFRERIVLQDRARIALDPESTPRFLGTAFSRGSDFSLMAALESRGEGRQFVRLQKAKTAQDSPSPDSARETTGFYRECSGGKKAEVQTGADRPSIPDRSVCTKPLG